MQETNGAKDTVVSKTELERFAAKYNVRIEHTHADNQPFAAAEFMQHCVKNSQTNSYCGVGAHWQNGIAKRHIGMMTSMAQTMLLHAQSMWPDIIGAKLWPFAIRQAVNFHNVCKHKGKTACPWKLFTDEEPPFQMSDFCVWGCPGCPGCTTDKRAQDGTHISHWEERA